MRVRLLDISDKKPHSQAPQWTQGDLDSPRPQKIAQIFFDQTQTKADGAPLLSYGGKHSSPDFPWHQPHAGAGGQGFNEYGDVDVSMSLRIWMMDTFGDAFPITDALVRDAMSSLAALCVKAATARGSKEHL